MAARGYRRLFGGGVRVRRANVRGERIPTVATVFVRDAHHRRDDGDRGRRYRRQGHRDDVV